MPDSQLFGKLTCSIAFALVAMAPSDAQTSPQIGQRQQAIQETQARLQGYEMAARNIAAEFLRDAYRTCGHSVGEDLEKAIEAIATVEPSPRHKECV
jgi:hypothetical protein